MRSYMYTILLLLHRENKYLKKSKEEIKQIAVDGAKLLKKLAKETTGNFTFEYSPESFQEQKLTTHLKCVMLFWIYGSRRKIIRQSSTCRPQWKMQCRMFSASQVEYFNKYLLHRENVLLSFHPHNDRGSGISDAELGILAGADRDWKEHCSAMEKEPEMLILLTLAMNMFFQGVDPELDFSNMSDICESV